MNQMQQTKVVSIVRPAAIVNNTSHTTASVDTNGWDYATIIVDLGATDIALTALKVQESDDDSSYADVTGLVFGTSNTIAGSASTLPSATDDNKFFVFDVDLRGRKRYLDLVSTVGNGSTGAYLSAICILSKGKDGPVTAAERGASQVLRVPTA